MMQEQKLLKDSVSSIKNAELVQSVCIQGILMSEWNSGFVFHWERGFAYEKTMDSFKIDKDLIQVREAST